MIIPKFVISDTHFGHLNILKYEPSRLQWGTTIEGMDSTMISAWNSVVGPDDWVLHCGDFAMGYRERIPAYRRALNGKIILVLGNHDRSVTAMELAGFQIVTKTYVFEAGGLRYVCKHNPEHFKVEEYTPNTRFLHGHTHSLGTPSFIREPIRSECRCLSVESLNSPAPVPLGSVKFFSKV